MSYAYVADGTATPPRHFVYVREEATPIVVKPFDVFVGLIQSNVRGAADDYDKVADQYNDPDVYMWNWAGQQIMPASEPLSVREPNDAMGVMNTFAKDYAATRLASDRRLLLVNPARGGTGFSLPSSNTTGGSGLHWDRTLPNDANNLAMTTRDALLSIMGGLPAGSRIIGFIANHGSTDGTNNMSKADFKAKLTDFIPWFRTAVGASTAPYIMMQMRPDLRIEGRHAAIDDAQTEVAAELPNVAKIASPNSAEFWRNGGTDKVHFNAAGVRKIGHDAFAQYITMPTAA